jgi:4-hydroxybenzoyl-CoA thioesterase
VLDIHTSIAEWRGKSFVQTHRVMRGDELILECTEVRVFARREGNGIRAVPVPQEILDLCRLG